MKHTIVYDSEDIISIIESIAEGIYKKYKDKQLTTICVLHGATTFSTLLNMALRIGEMFLTIESCEVSSYRDNKQGEIHNIRMPSNLKGSVIILDDISDTGKTFDYIKSYIKENYPKVTSIECCSMLVKHDCGGYSDYPSLTIDKDEFIYGFGLDNKGLYRELPFIAEEISNEGT